MQKATSGYLALYLADLENFGKSDIFDPFKNYYHGD
jgi:hypothetical protein